MRVDCPGKQLRLSVKGDDGKTQILLVRDPGQFEIKSGESLACGVQKPRRVTVSFKAASAKGASAEATSLEFQR